MTREVSIFNLNKYYKINNIYNYLIIKKIFVFYFVNILGLICIAINSCINNLEPYGICTFANLV